MTRAWFSLAVLLTTAGLLCWAAEVGNAEMDAAESAGLLIGEPIREGNLTIFPVSTKTAKLEDRFITLDEGMRSGKVEILEVSAIEGTGTGRQPVANEAPLTLEQVEQLLPDSRANGNDAPPQNVAQEAGQVAEASRNEQNEQAVQQQLSPFGGNDVNRLMVVNRSEKPLYLMPGEVIVGGDQDRTIGRELVIAPTGKPTPIEVFCVEHGRWGGRSEAVYAELFAASDSIARSSLNVVLRPGATGIAGRGSPDTRAIAAEANSGKFIGSIGSLNKGARLAVQKGEGQSEVWNQVSMQNAAAGVQPASGAFTENYASKDVVKRLDRYQDALEGSVAETENVVGVIVAVNGKVESMDVFESTPLFQKLWPKLLKSYALDALKADDGRTNHKQLGRGDARYFMNDVAAAKAKQPADGEAGLATVHGENERVLLFSAHERRRHTETTIELSDSQASASDQPTLYRSYGGVEVGVGGFGGVHTSAFSK